MKQEMLAILNKIKEYDRIIIFRHFRPDGDAVGSTKGLQRILQLTFPEKEIYLQNNDFSDYLAFLGGEDEPLADEMFADALGIVLDTATVKRISSPKYALCKELCKIDHHIDIAPYGDVSWVEDLRSSTCEMIVHFYNTFKDELKIDSQAATYLYTGMVTDSGRFRYRDVSGETLRLAATLLEQGIDTDRIYANLYLEAYGYLKFKAHVYQRMQVTENGVAYLHVDKAMQEEFNLSLEAASASISCLDSIICDLIVRHKTTFKVLLSLLMVAFGGALIRQMRMGASAGGLLVRVLQALTRGVFSFSRALLASPLTWWLLALGALYLILEDIYYFATDGESVIGDLLNEWFGKENTEEIKKDLAEIVEGIIEFGGIVKEVAKDIFPYFVKLSKFMVKLQTTYLKAIFLIISAIIYGIAKIGRWIGKGIGYLVVNVPKWLDKVGKFVSDTWEGIKKGTEEVWNGIKNFIGSTIDGIIGFFKNMWKTACDYVNKTIDKLQELNPFQEKSEAFGAWWHDFKNGNPADKLIGTTRLPINRSTNIKSKQTNNITINTNESAKAAKSAVERYSKDLIPSYVPQMN